MLNKCPIIVVEGYKQSKKFPSNHLLLRKYQEDNMKTILFLLVTIGLSTAQDCMSTNANKRCIPKAEAGSYGQHSALFQDGDPCFTLAPYGTICYVGTKTQKFDYCSVSSPGCYDFGCRFSNQTRVGPFKKSCLELPESIFFRCGRSS